MVYLYWREVSQEPPPKNVRLIVGNLDWENSDIRTLGPCDDDIDPVGLWYAENDRVEPLPYAEVTHWMPMPGTPFLISSVPK